MVAVTLGWAVLGEPVDAAMLLGGAIVVLSVIVIATAESRVAAGPSAAEPV